MKKIALVFSIIFFSTISNAQVDCGFDKLISTIYTDSISKGQFDTIRANIRKKAAEIRQANISNRKVQQNNYVIPVVFHLVGTNPSSLTDAQVTAQLNLLNTAFSTTVGSTHVEADEAQIQFCLAQKLPNGNAWSTLSSYNSNLYSSATSGITRCSTSVANTISFNHHMDATGANSQQALVNIAYTGFNTTNYLNIWVVERISLASSPYSNVVAGYGTFPFTSTTIDGITMRLNAFGIGTAYSHSLTSQGTILVHETGHYLGLLHTFHNGCAGTNTATCYSAGDECCDTPPVLAPNQNSCSFFGSNPPNSCSETPSFPDMYENYMDYQYDNVGHCRNTFTNDQVDRMHSNIQLYRSNLVSFSNHIVTGLTLTGGCQANAISPIFTTNLPNASKQVCVGQSIGFTAGSASTYTWTFSGATPSVAVGTSSPTGIVYSTPGTYPVTLNITDVGGNSYNSTMQIYVSNCNAISNSRANWYFGFNASVSFSTGIATWQPNSAMQTIEASAAISNTSGNLLFYTNGRSVYNNTHVAMTNGNTTLNGSPNGWTFGGNISNGQGVVIVPRPGNANRYYIYTTSDAPTSPVANTSFGVSQYEVDMTTSTGSVVSTTPVNPTQNYATNEPIVAIPHCNGTDYWLCVKPRNNNQNGLLNAGPSTSINQYIACYSVTATGISNTPVLSLSAPYTPSVGFVYSNDGISQINVSPDKSLIVVGDRNTSLFYLYNFDCSSGKTNYVATLNGTMGYGVVFSPNSKILYAMASTGNNIIQFDLSQISVCNSTPPFKMFQTGFNGFNFNSLQLGPDNRIYCGHSGANFLSVINFPDMVNTSNTSNECGFNYAAIPFTSGICRADLPNDITSQIGQTADDFSFCLSNCGQAKFTNLGCGTTFSWNFGDGYTISGTNTVIPTGTVTTGNYEYPVHTYSATGTYVVTLSIDGRPNVTHTVVISTPPTPTITGSAIACTTNTLTPFSYYAPVGYTYNWYTANGTPSVSTQQNIDVTWLTLPAVLSLTITNAAGCSSTTSLTIYSSSNVSVTATSNTVCPTAPSTTLSVIGAASFTWQPGNLTGNPVVVTPTATTIYTITGVTSANCAISKTVQVNYTAAAGPTISVNNPTICSGTSTVLTASGANTYTWSNGANTASVNVYPPVTTVYTVTGTNTLTGCGASKTSTVTVKTTPTVTATANPTLICASQTSTLSANGATTYSWSTGATTSVTVVTPTATSVYTVTGTTSGCSNTKTITVNVIPYAPVITTSATAVAICSGGAATVTASGASTYTWNTGAITSVITVTPSVPTVYTVSGNYSITGCGTGSTTIVVNPVISTLCCSAATSTLGTSLTNTVSVPAGTYTTSSAVVYVQGCITFTANTSYSGYTFRMAPGASIRVHPNKTLTLTNCKLYSCSELWDGIYLLNDYNYWCGNIIVNNSTIEDMYNGIVMDYNNMTLNPSAPSGTISITGSKLNKNYVSVQMRNNISGYTGGITNDYLLSLKTSTISSNASTTSPGAVLKPSSISSYTYAYNNITNGTMGTSAPYVNFPRAFIGIKLNELCYRNNAVVGDFGTGSNTNTFDNLDFGINGTNVSTKVSNNYFKNITGSAKQMDLDSWSFPASGPDEIGIAVAITETVSPNIFNVIVGDNTVLPSGGNPFPRGNKFEDCNKGIQVKNSKNTTAKANYFTATTTSTLVQTVIGTPPMQVVVTNPNTYYFYKAQNAEYITSIGTTGNISYNFIRNHATGIYANHTLVSGGTPVLDITDNDISAPSSTGYCMQAIQVDQAGGINFSTDRLTIYNNTIEQVYRGIIANGVLNGLLIKQNPRVFIESTSKTLNYGATQPRTAIILTNCQNGYVKGNAISSNTVAPTSTTTAQYMNGVYVTNSINSKVECNSTSNLGRCFIFQQSCTNSSWKVNAMSNSYTGLEMRTGAVMGNQGTPPGSGTPNLSANTWTTITRQTNAVSSPSVNATSKLFLLAGATTQPTLNFSQFGSAAYTQSLGGINVTTGTSYTCNSGSAQRTINSDGKSSTNGNSAKISQESDTLMLYTLLASQDENDYEFFPEEMTYLNKQSVFKLLEEDSIQAVSGTVLDNFYQNQQNSAIDKLTEVQNAIANYDTTNALVINTAVTTKNTVEYKHQRANELVIKYMQNHAYVFNSTEMSDLFNMASECISKGYYVVQCRSLVNILQNTVVNFTDNCEEEANASRRMKPISEESVVSKTNFYLYPNPNNGDMILDYDLGGYSNAIVNLCDITGKVIGAYKLQSNKGILQMNEQNLNNGIYFYSILVGEKTIKTDKIVIIK